MLKKLRLSLEPKKSQEEIAALLGVSLSIYQRAESNPDNATPKLLVGICKLYGVSLEDILPSEEEGERITITPPYEELFRKTSLLKSYFYKFSTPLNEEVENLIQNLLSSLSAVARKPNLGVMGRSDAGKSYFINYLLGEAKLPSKLQPTTSAITVVKHLEDRPKTVKGDVILFNGLCDLSQLSCPDYYDGNDMIYKSGSYDLLADEIVHDHFDTSENDAYSCVVFVDAPILTSCNILDAPGFANIDMGSGSGSDTAKALSILSMLDALIYMSPVTGCMDKTDIASLRTVFKSVPEPKNTDLPPLNNIFFVVSQAAHYIRDIELDELKRTASTRIYNHFLVGDKEGLLHERSKEYEDSISPDTLLNRFYTFFAESVTRRRDLTDDLTNYLQSTMPQIIDGNVNKTLTEYKQKGNSYLSNKISQIESEIIQFDNVLKKYRELIRPENVATQTSEIETLRFILLTSKKKKTAALKLFSEQLIGRHSDVDNLEKIIKEKYKDKNEAKEYAFPHIMERVQLYIEKKYISEMGELEREISDNLDSFSAGFNKIDRVDDVSIPFDSKGAFVGLSVGGGLMAGLGIYASTMGALGGYAVAAQGVGLLSSLGIGFGATGGTAGVMSGIAAIGGPVVLAGILGGIVFLGAKRLFGDSWQKRLAKQIIKTMDEKGIGKKIVDNVVTEFNKAEDAINAGCNNLKEHYINHIKMMDKVVQNPAESKEDLDHQVKQLKESLDFFMKAPWD